MWHSPRSAGARITGVDDKTFSSTGESFSAIVIPNTESSVSKTIQKDEVSLAYEFAKKFPGVCFASAPPSVRACN